MAPFIVVVPFQRWRYIGSGKEFFFMALPVVPFLFNSSAFNVVKQENAKMMDDDSKAEMAQVVCSLQNREECMACGS
jgi:hypothetical protein